MRESHCRGWVRYEECEEADKNSPIEEIVERLMFDGMVSFASRTLRSGFANSVGRSMPYTPNKR